MTGLILFLHPAFSFETPFWKMSKKCCTAAIITMVTPFTAANIAENLNVSLSVVKAASVPPAVAFTQFDAPPLCRSNLSDAITDIVCLLYRRNCVFFRKDRELLDCLFFSVRDVISRMFFNMNKSEAFTPGFICVLHTFGRDLKWNPHIHVLLSEGGCGNFTPWRPIKYFNYTLLRNSFRTVLLNRMEDHIGKSFKKMKSYIYKHCPNGFYVYAKPKLTNPKDVIKYIGRYLGRPVIATSRIDNYDGHNVTFHYNSHEDNQLVTETVSAVEFIKKLIVHIPDKHFKMIRYYGIYAKHHKNSDKLFMAVSREKIPFIKSTLCFRFQLMLAFGYDPLWCDCGHRMSILEICHKGSPLIEIHTRKLDSS